jgi:flagellar motor switch protein FliG
VTPQAVDRIGQSLMAELDNKPERAFATLPEDRIAAILTAASDDLRDKVMNGLRETDMIIALCHANGNGMEEVSEFIPSGLSRRMAKTTREEIEERGAVKTKEGEPAVTALVSGTQGQITAGEISFVDLDDN